MLFTEPESQILVEIIMSILRNALKNVTGFKVNLHRLFLKPGMALKEVIFIRI